MKEQNKEGKKENKKLENCFFLISEIMGLHVYFWHY